MFGENTVTHRQLNSLLYSKGFPCSSVREQVRALESALRDNRPGRQNPHLNLTFKNTYSISDEDFKEVCELIPIDLDEIFFFGGKPKLDDSFCVHGGGGTKCVFYRHINALYATEHEHSFFELSFVWEGNFVQYTNGKRYDIPQGGFVVTPPGMRHVVRAVEKDGIIFNMLIPKTMMRTTLFEALVCSHPLSKYLRMCMTENEIKEPYVYFNKTLGQDLRQVFKFLIFENYKGHANPMVVNGFLNQIFGIIMNDGGIQDEGCVYDILRYVNENYQTVCLGDLSRQFGYNEAYLSRLIKKETGENFSSLLRQTRISYAEELLSQSEISIQDIGEIVGYNDYAGFSRAFEKEKGMKPEEFRRIYVY